MTASELKQKYLDFFVSKRHKILPNVSLIPENDPTALFISAGMHPLVPYLLGEPHPLGRRLVSVQRCLRTDDIDEVGDKVHHTFFEMLGNWSLGDYWKKEAIEWSFEFLISKEWLGIEKEKLAVSVFAGDGDAPFDKDSYDIWSSLGISPTRIAKLPKENNWWGPVGETGPCGPDTEMFVWTGKELAPDVFDPENPEWVEIWNNVFMEYRKKSDGGYEPLKQKNVDTGMGLERTTAVLSGFDDDYQTDIFRTVINKIEETCGKRYDDHKKDFRIIADHLRAAIFMVADGIEPSNKERGYVLRRLLRRAMVKTHLLGIIEVDDLIRELGYCFLATITPDYPEVASQKAFIIKTLQDEAYKFDQTIVRGLKEFNKIKQLDGKTAFNLFQSHGFSWELTLELAREKGLEIINKDDFQKEFERHREISRTSSVGMFKGGLADNTELSTRYHTATHLLQVALRQVLGEHVQQKGSNITSERMRFDFTHPQKITVEELEKVEALVNRQIEANLSVSVQTMTLKKAKDEGALAFFTGKYDEQVKVYSIGDFSKEVCGGPHADFTGGLGKFKIIKEETAGAGIRRIYATLK